MKRTRQDVVGGPIIPETRGPDVAGGSMYPAVPELSSDLAEPRDANVYDASLAEEFAEFVAGAAAAESPMFPAPDPIFRERLRRTLWRMHVLTQAPGAREPH